MGSCFGASIGPFWLDFIITPYSRNGGACSSWIAVRIQQTKSNENLLLNLNGSSTVFSIECTYNILLNFFFFFGSDT